MRFILGLAFVALHFQCRPVYKPANHIASALPEVVDFNFHIKPILSDRCFPCHGPDKNALKADLQLHLPEGALDKQLGSGHHAFVPEKIQKSEAFLRILSDDPDYQMPPPDFQRRLDSFEIALMAKWIEQGAMYKKHWAFIPPKKPPTPLDVDEKWCRNEIDAFILGRLRENGRRPNREADKEILLRRVTLDLTGLPPTVQEIDAYLSDDAIDAYDQVVDRLLASPHFGERMALMWLDVARYADSNGYSQDGLRVMWPWRDWVIEAFNRNMPYDQFLTCQLAGDKLPNATNEQILATGFLRNHRLNGEGGIIDEEYRIEYVADRTETAATVFSGLTMQCARCHDHKYDPISQEEYYNFFGFFNNINERGITANDGNSGPELVLESAQVKNILNLIDQKIAARQAEGENIAKALETVNIDGFPLNLEDGLLLDLSFDRKTRLGFTNRAKVGEAFPIQGDVHLANGVKGKAIQIGAYDFVTINKKALKFERSDAFSFSFYFKCSQKDSSVSILNHLGSAAINYPGYEIGIQEGYPMMRLVHSLPAVQIEIRSNEKIRYDKWEHLVYTYDGSGKADGAEIYLNGSPGKRIVFDRLSQGITNRKGALKVGGMMAYQTDTKGRGYVDELKIYSRALSKIEVASLSVDRTQNWSDFSDLEKLDHQLRYDLKYRNVLKALRQHREEKFAIQDTLISVMVMEDLPNPRPTFVLERGVYDAPGKRVPPGTPRAIPPLSDGNSSNRLDLANWLLDGDNPLTSRVAVNRFWQVVFGQGIVKTLEDFGSQGALPTHPELLDWLAVHFKEEGWDIKGLLRLMVLSSTYRQSSQVSATERAIDPENRLLARGPRMRLSAEMIRDCALAASGLLVRQIGGPSVKPYQPSGLWSEKGEFSVLKHYEQGHGPDLYRRSLYTFWRRTSPPPSMTTFDAPTRDICTVSRQATNTPLQALVLQNDPQFVEAARVLASRVAQQFEDDKDAIVQGYRTITGLYPDSELIDLLLDLHLREYHKFLDKPFLVNQLLQVGEYPPSSTDNKAAIAALTMVMSTIMSFDETVTKR